MSPLSLLVIALPYLLYGVESVEVKQPLVCSLAGCMLGTTMPGYQIPEFEAFMGIPYAMPPVGPLRFSNPKALPKWKANLNVTTPQSDCIQKNYLMPTPSISGSEDCLYLNVYRPTIRNKRAPLPVMVYIHGGGWFSGTASPGIHGPEYFMDTQAVILVTVAYRLGPFGFLSTLDNNMPGNFGLKDQSLALRWVQKNIKAFGGDPKKVTIFGQSAGGVSVHMHMLSKLSAGLFSNAIAMSGTANVPFAMTEKPIEQTRQLAAYCNITNAEQLSTVKITQALRQLNAEDILNAADKFKYWDVDNMVTFHAVVEKPGGRDAFLTAHPINILKAGSFKPVPLMLGTVPQEGAVRVVSIMENATLRTQFNERFDELFEKLLEFPVYFNAEQRKLKTQEVITEYFAGQHKLNNSTAQGFMDTITDRGFHNPLYNTMSEYVQKVNTVKYPLRMYVFNYKGPNSFARLYTNAPRPQPYGVVHCDDLLYLFRSPLVFPDYAKDSVDAEVVAKFVGHFVDFAKSSKPLLNVKPCNLKNFQSPAAGTNAICDYVTFINSNNENKFLIKTESQFNVKRMQFWNNLLRPPRKL